MVKNYMADVAKMLGVELEEEFNINSTKTLYKITDKGLCYKDDNIWYEMSSDTFIDLIKGDSKIVKLPWQPKDGDEYYCPVCSFKDVSRTNWVDSVCDFAYKEAGLIFNTYEECEAALPELRKKYLGGDDNV